MRPPTLPILALATLAACGTTEFFVPPTLVSTLRVDARATTVVVNDVSMPEYAINQEIPVQEPGGGLIADTDRLWADLPDRALQVALARHLNVITDAEVSIEPWPLSGFPDAEVTITVEDMIVRADGAVSFTGIYAIRDEVRRTGQIEVFAIAAPVPGSGYAAIVAAHESAWLELAERIARQL